MKKSTAIMPIGSSHLVMILVRNKPIICLAIAAVIQSVVGCRLESPPQNNDAADSFLCGTNCDASRYNLFKDRLIHIEVEPAVNLPQVFYNIQPNNLPHSPIVLNKSVHISGRALGVEDYWEEEQKSEGHDRKASFFDIIAIPLVKEGSLLAPRTPTIKSRLGKDGIYTIELISNLPYSLILNPVGQLNQAPLHINLGTLLHDGIFNFPHDNKKISLTGRVITEDNPVLSNAPQSLMRARIVQGTRLISSIGAVGSDGVFSVEISDPLFTSDVGVPINLIVEPNDIEIALPKVVKKLEKNQLNKNLDIGEVSLGSLKKPINLTVEVRGSDDSSISKAVLFLNAKVGLGETMVKKQVNAMGSVQFNQLYEGHYDIAIVPPFDSKFAMRVIKDVELNSEENSTLSIDLQEREAFCADIFGPTGKPVSGALIEFSRIGEVGLFASEDIYDDMLFKLTAGTNDHGQVCHRKFGFETSNNQDCSDLLLDEGRYLAHIIPPAGTELSHKWLTIDFPKEKKLHIVLDQPAVLKGQILSHDQKTPIKRAFVTIYLAEITLHNQPKIIGNAITDERGFFTAFVSALE